MDAALVAYCGLSCAGCLMYRGRVADLARDLRAELRAVHFDRFAKDLRVKDYATCYESLGAMVKLRCKRSCRGGGGMPICKIRTCAREKAYAGCWECAEMEGCRKLAALSKYHDDAFWKNLRRIREVGLAAFCAGKQAS